MKGTVTIPMKYSIFIERNRPKLVLNQFTFLKNLWTVRVFLMMVQTVSKTVCGGPRALGAFEPEVDILASFRGTQFLGQNFPTLK